MLVDRRIALESDKRHGIGCCAGRRVRSSSNPRRSRRGRRAQVPGPVGRRIERHLGRDVGAHRARGVEDEQDIRPLVGHGIARADEDLAFVGHRGAADRGERDGGGEVEEADGCVFHGCAHWLTVAGIRRRVRVLSE